MKSSFCDTNACIEVEYDDQGLRIKSTLTGGWVSVTAAEWLAFLAGVKNGDFDNLVPAIPPEGTEDHE